MTDVRSGHGDRPSSSDTPRPGPLGRLTGLAYRRRGRVLIAWTVALAAAFGRSAIPC
jgi:RND superfamily putative drug exporter